MAVAPTTAAAALALMTNATGKIVAQGFDLGQLVGATNDASCLFFTQNKMPDQAMIMFVSAATASASAGVLTIARAFSATGITVYRYVISTTELQTLGGPDAAAVFTQVVSQNNTDYEWVDNVRRLVTLDPHA